MSTAYTVGKLAALTGIGKETVRFYERKGLLPEPLRDASKYRRYSNDDVRRINFIRGAKALGFSLSEIKQLLDLRADAGADCSQVRAISQKKIAELESEKSVFDYEAPGAEQPAGLLFREANLSDVFLSLGKMAGVNVVFDRDFVDRLITIELHDTSFEEALRSLCQVSHNFFHVQSENIVTIIPDIPAKRQEYDQQVTKTFYLSTADLKETIDILRIVLGARRVAPHTASNALTIIDTPEKVAAAERIITSIDKNMAEVVVHLELLEVNRSRLEDYGIQLRTPGSEGIATGAFPDQETTLADSPYRDSNVTVAGLPGAVVQLLRMDGDTRILANPNLRAVDGQTATAQFGERVPIPITTFTPIAQGGIAQQPVTTFEYQNIGVNIEVTPRTHHNGEVSLQLKVQLDNISGTTLQGLPTFGNRYVDTMLRLKDGETSLLAGLILNEERTSMAGLPGLANVPVIGRLFAANHEEVKGTDIVLMITPRIVRQVDLTLDDLRSHAVEEGAGGTVIYDMPVPVPRQVRPDPDEEDEEIP